MSGEKLPLAIEIEINSECNLSCSYCPNSRHKRVEQGEMKVELYDLIMRQLAAIKYAGRISYHFYNEPTLSKNLELFAEMTKSYLPQAKTNLFSNGTLLNQRKIESLIAKGIDKLTLTEHEKINLRKIESAKLEMTAESASKVRVVKLAELPLTNRGGALPEVGRTNELPLTTPCFIPSCVMIITVQGNVVPCYEDYFQKNVMGNVVDTDLVQIWNSPRYVQFRQDLKLGRRNLYEACKDCNNHFIIN